MFKRISEPIGLALAIMWIVLLMGVGLVAFSEAARSEAFPPGPAMVLLACQDLQGVREVEVASKTSAWVDGNAVVSEHVRKTCYLPQRAGSSPISLGRAVEKFGAMEVVKCFQDIDGDWIVIFYAEKAEPYRYSFWYRVPDREAVCAAGVLGSEGGDDEIISPVGLAI